MKRRQKLLKTWKKYIRKVKSLNLNNSKHNPVLLKESIDSLKISPSHTIVDATLGGGGHAQEIMARFQGYGKLLAFDSDKTAIQRFAQKLESKGFKSESVEKNITRFTKDGSEVILVNENFDNLKEVLSKLKIEYINGLIADLGMSTDQIFDKSRGFSYQNDGPLDMRMDNNLQVTAADLVNGLYKKELEKLFTELGDEWFASKITNAILKERKKVRISTTMQLKNIIAKAVPDYYKKGSADPAMRVFQALRIAVNHELDSLRSLLPQALEALKSGDRMVFISFQSGEDRLIKKFFINNKTKALIVSEKPIRPSDEEINQNPKSRSAKLRILEKK